MSKFYLQGYGVNNSQESVLKGVIKTLSYYIGEYSEPLIYFESNGALIMNPYIDRKGEPVNPVEEYGVAFLESDFMKLAKSVKLEADAPREKVKEAVENALISKLGLNNRSELERWLDSYEFTLHY